MMIDMIVITALIGISFVGFYFGIIRNTQVCSFLQAVSHVCYERQMEFISDSVIPADKDGFESWNKEMKEIDRVVDNIRSVPYVKVLFSFKSLKIENWFTEEQVKFLRGETHRPEDFYVKGTNVDMTTL